MLSHVLMVVMHMQLLHILHMYLLRLAPQAHAFTYTAKTKLLF